MDVDYLKYDWCNTDTRNAQEAYATMRDALAATGRPIVFSMCEWGTAKPWQWAQNTGNLWRTTGDISDHWKEKRNGTTEVAARWECWTLWMRKSDLRARPDRGTGTIQNMLEVGNGGMTTLEYRSHFSSGACWRRR